MTVTGPAHGAAAALRIFVLLTLAIVVLPATASAQRDQFFDALLPFYRALAGVHGDEGPELTKAFEQLSAALTRWDRALAKTEIELQKRLTGGDSAAALEARVVLASMYAERHRIDDALREIDGGLRLDGRRVVFYRFRALLLQAAGEPELAADAFRTAWLLDSDDPQNAYRLVVHRSAQTTENELERALDTLTTVERELVRAERGRAEAPFLTLNSINDDIGGGLAFAPAAYAPALAFLIDGEFERGLTALRAALAADPLIVDPASRTESMRHGIAAVRRGDISPAIEHLLAATANNPDSSEAHRILGTVYGIQGNVESSLGHFHTAVRLNRRDERSWLSLALALDAAGRLEETVEVVRTALGELPDSGALRWVHSITSGKRQRTDEADLELIAVADRLVLLAGKADLYGHVAEFAEGHFDYDRSIDLLQQRVALMPNDAAAHKALGRAYVAQGREDEGYAELVMALLLDPLDPDALTVLGRLHLGAGRYARAVDVLERTVALQPANRQALHALGSALLRAGRKDEGQAKIEESERARLREIEEQRRRRTAGMLALQAAHEIRERRYERAIDLWRQVIELEGGGASNHVELAEALAGAGRLDEAALQFQTAIALKAGPEAHRRLAEVYDELGRAADSARERRTYIERRLEHVREPFD